MELSLGIRLVIILPTLLFLIGFSFKSIIEKKSALKLIDIDKKISDELWYDYYFLLGVDSIFLFIANGLIIIFELENTELGIVTIISGLIFSMVMLIGIYSGITDSRGSLPSGALASIGLIGIFGSFGGEVGYFASYGIEMTFARVMVDTLSILIGAILGVLAALAIIMLSIKK